MKDFISLRILDRFRTVFEAVGCDYPIMRKILQAKLTMDSRRVPTILSRNARRAPDRNGFLTSLWVYLFMGVILIPFVVMGRNYLFQMSVVFGILMFLVMTSMISDFSTVLLDIRDRIIIATKPVTGRTLGFARAIHVVIYLTLLTTVLAGPSLLAAFIAQGFWFGLTFALSLVWMDLLIMTVTTLLYLGILNFFDGERMKDFINYVQIGLSIAMVIGYQVIGRVFDVVKLRVVLRPAWWQAVIPPMWFGALFAELFGRQSSNLTMILLVLALFVPLALFFAYVRFMPAFETRLEKLSATTTHSPTTKHGWRRNLARLACRRRDERTMFEFASIMMGREREFKLKVYPSLGFAIAFPFILIFNPAWSQGLHSLGSSHWYLAIYMSSVMIPTVLMTLRYSGQYKAAWIYQVSPIEHLEDVFKGTVKAFVYQLFLPVYFIEGLVFTVLFGIRVIPDLTVALLSMLVYAVIAFRFLRKGLPFSEPFQLAQPSERIVGLILLALVGVMAGLQFLVTLMSGAIYWYMIFLVLANMIAWRIGFRVKGINAVRLGA